MSFKKIIAGILAGALSACLTAVTAIAADTQDTIKFYYDLKESYWGNSTDEVTITQNYTAGNYYLSDVATATITGEDNITTTEKENVAYLTFGAALPDLTPKSIEVVISNSKNLSTKWTYDVNAPLYMEAGIINTVSSGVFNVPISLGGYANTINFSGFLDSQGRYAFNSIVVTMKYSSDTHYSVTSLNENLQTSWTSNIVDDNGNIMKPSYAGCTSIKQGEYGCLQDKPMKSSLTVPANVIAALETSKVNNTKYTCPIAVLNDAIANGSNVTFTFVSYDGMVDKDGKITTDKNKAVWNHIGFDQHLYTGNYNFSGTGKLPTDIYGSYSNAWGINLFEGGLVVNSGLTMQLNQTDKFIWNSNSLTFDWESITENNVTNANNFLVSMSLYTPVDWYWDRLIVEVEPEIIESEDIAAGAGEEDDGEEIIEEDEVTEIVLIDPDSDIETLPAETVTEIVLVEPDSDIETLPAEEIATEEEFIETTTEDNVISSENIVEEISTSPQTGNPNVAMVIIPIAIMASGIIIKKRL